jgi:hypothetical protein
MKLDLFSCLHVNGSIIFEPIYCSPLYFEIRQDLNLVSDVTNVLSEAGHNLNSVLVNTVMFRKRFPLNQLTETIVP